MENILSSVLKKTLIGGSKVGCLSVCFCFISKRRGGLVFPAFPRFALAIRRLHWLEEVAPVLLTNHRAQTKKKTLKNKRQTN